MRSLSFDKGLTNSRMVDNTRPTENEQKDNARLNTEQKAMA